MKRWNWNRIGDVAWAISSVVCILSLTLIALHSVLK